MIDDFLNRWGFAFTELNGIHDWRHFNRQLFGIDRITHGDASSTDSHHSIRGKSESKQVIFRATFLKFPLGSSISSRQNDTVISNDDPMFVICQIDFV